MESRLASRAPPPPPPSPAGTPQQAHRYTSTHTNRNMHLFHTTTHVVTSSGVLSSSSSSSLDLLPSPGSSTDPQIAADKRFSNISLLSSPTTPGVEVFSFRAARRPLNSAKDRLLVLVNPDGAASSGCLLNTNINITILIHIQNVSHSD